MLTAQRPARVQRAMRSKWRGCPAKAGEKDVGQLGSGVVMNGVHGAFRAAQAYELM